MKIIKSFLLLAVIAAAFIGCTNTRNALGIDTVNGFIRTGKWTTLTKGVYAPGSNTGTTTDILTNGRYLQFKTDNRAHIYDVNNTEISSAPYHFTDTKTMVYDGVEYKVQENFVSTVSTMTLVNESSGGKTVLTFKR